jgi:predicted metal-dependent RNase
MSFYLNSNLKQIRVFPLVVYFSLFARKSLSALLFFKKSVTKCIYYLFFIKTQSLNDLFYLQYPTKRIFLLLKTDYISIKSKDSSNYSTTNVLCLIYNQLGK